MCNSGCRSSIAGTRPSSAVQLPITATLYAEHLTLFGIIIHHLAANVNRENIDIVKSISKIQVGISRKGYLFPCIR